jgi:hypothetical protein
VEVGHLRDPHPGLYKAGDTLRIDYIDDHGRIYLVRDPEGKIEAINSSDVFMTAPLK